MKASLQLIERMVDRNIGDKERSLLASFINKANQQVDKLTFLVETLLDVSRIQAGKVQLQFSTFSMKEVVDDCIYEIQSTGRHQVMVEGETEFMVCADKNRIEQVLINFLTNAIKYSPEAEKVNLSVVHDEKNMSVVVKDYGIGIPREKLDLVFDRFFRVEESSSQISGLGLGLFISADIIKRHGGEVHVKSEPGTGSEFSFSIPIANNQNNS